MQVSNSRLSRALLVSLFVHAAAVGIAQLEPFSRALTFVAHRGSAIATSADYHNRKTVSAPPIRWVDVPRSEVESTHAKPTQIAPVQAKPRDDVQLSKTSTALGAENVPERPVAENLAADAVPPKPKQSILVFESADYELLTEGRSTGDDARYYFAEEVDIRILALDNIDPQYPREALVRGHEGRVVIDVLVDENNEVVKREVVYGIAPFAQAAMDTIAPVRFTAAVRKQKNVKGRIMIEFLYQLNAK
jgi:TonB family protein